MPLSSDAAQREAAAPCPSMPTWSSRWIGSRSATTARRRCSAPPRQQRARRRRRRARGRRSPPAAGGSDAPRPAPSAARTASSRCRAVARASSRLATFAQAISSTNATAPSMHEQRRPDVAGQLLAQRNDLRRPAGVEVRKQRGQLAGDARSCRAAPARCVTPGFSSADGGQPPAARRPRRRRGSRPATHRSTVLSRKENPGGITPTTDVALPCSVIAAVDNRRVGAEARVRQSRSLMTTTRLRGWSSSHREVAAERRLDAKRSGRSRADTNCSGSSRPARRVRSA